LYILLSYCYLTSRSESRSIVSGLTRLISPSERLVDVSLALVSLGSIVPDFLLEEPEFLRIAERIYLIN
jgi:hypothetical protein